MTIEEIRAEALDKARHGQSVANYAAIFSGFTAKGIAESDILPRENVLTFQAWKAVGRSVRKGEHGVKVCTYVPIKDKDTGEVIGRSPHTTTVFHISQTEDTAEAEKRWSERRAAKSAESSDTGRTWEGRRYSQSPENRDRDGERRRPTPQVAPLPGMSPLGASAERWSDS